MTEKENFLRNVKSIYDAIIPINYSDKKTEIEKLKELERWNNDFIKQTNNVEKILNERINFKLISPNDKSEIEEAIKEIISNYQKSLDIY